MQMQTIEVQTFAGKRKMEIPATGEVVITLDPIHHADFKTASVFPDRYPTIPAQSEVEIVGWMQNLYGVHVKVRHNRNIYDVEVNRLNVLKHND
jgi:hypothetical protein